MPEANRRMKIEGMTCPGCDLQVARALSQAGALEVRADYRSGEAVFQAGPGVSVAELERAVAAAGYRPVTTVEPPGTGEGYDLAVIGSGSAAFAAAIRAREAGASVLLVEQGIVGGTCVNVGCIPSKALLRRAEVRHLAGRHGYSGIQTAVGAVDARALVEEKDRLVAGLRREKYEDLLVLYGIEFLRGRAVFRDPKTLEVDGREIRAERYLVATGASPALPELPGFPEVSYLTSATALSLTEVPKSLLILGTGFVALELGQYFQRLGTAVTLIGRGQELLRGFEPEFGPLLRESLATEGMSFRLGVEVRRVEPTADGVSLHISNGGQEEVLAAERLLVAIGRQPNTANLGLERAGVGTGSRGEVLVNDRLQTENPRIYAAGDVTGGPQFVYVAAYEGRVAAGNALGGLESVDLATVPAVIFTDPAVAMVGLTEAGAQERGKPVRTTLLPLSSVPRALVNGQTRGAVKLVAEEGTGRILGVGMVGENAGEVIYAATLAVRYGLSISNLVETLAPYLTMAEGLRLAAQTFDKDVSRLSCCAY